jgi:hypothetical protein
MSKPRTIELRKPNALRPEWRRLCHIYTPQWLRSICGTATRPHEAAGHAARECEAPGHTVCVVCCDLETVSH